MMAMGEVAEPMQNGGSYSVKPTVPISSYRCLTCFIGKFENSFSTGEVGPR